MIKHLKETICVTKPMAKSHITLHLITTNDHTFLVRRRNMYSFRALARAAADTFESEVLKGKRLDYFQGRI